MSEKLISYQPQIVEEKRETIKLKPPSPPPLPVKSSAMEFPQLDFADMSFDFGCVPDIPDMLASTNHQGGYGQAVTGDQMEVDMNMDVQDWLDSLVVPVNKMEPE